MYRKALHARRNPISIVSRPTLWILLAWLCSKWGAHAACPRREEIRSQMYHGQLYTSYLHESFPNEVRMQLVHDAKKSDPKCITVNSIHLTSMNPFEIRCACSLPLLMLSVLIVLIWAQILPSSTFDYRCDLWLSGHAIKWEGWFGYVSAFRMISRS